ncbi:MAG TPA: amidohydrolase [Gemmatimonadaceae bacterium]
MLNGVPSDISISNGRIERINAHDPMAPTRESRVIDASGLHAFPSFRNAHTHVAMVLFRGYGDDMPLMQWLRTRIWPAEAQLTEDDVYAGARLGILEMIRGGTTFFNEMYWHRPALLRAAEELGVRAMIGQTIINAGGEELLNQQKKELERLAAEEPVSPSGRVKLCAAPHSIYTVKPDELRWIAGIAEKYGLLVHIHLSETQEEVDDCIRIHGCRPARLLEQIGLVNSNLIAAHGQFLDDDELDMLGKAGAAIVTNPAANLKLATGGIFPYTKARSTGIRVCLGTDGAASNNTLSMIESMKLAALLQKHREHSAVALPATEALDMATTTPAEVFHEGSGMIEAGAPADLVLVDFSAPETQPLHDPVSQLVYAANAWCVHTTICDGKVLMHGRIVEVCDEREVIEHANTAIRGALSRVSRNTA